MKRYYAAAGALLLGTSALAWAGDADKVSVEPVKVATQTETDLSWDKSTLATKSDTVIVDESRIGLSSLDKDLAKLAVAETDHKVQTASADSWTDTKVETASFDGAKVETASLADAKVDTAWSDTDKLQTVSTDGDGKVRIASVDKVDTGMGGPLEEGGNATAADLTPRQATQNYPPCSPGPGDDNCIQLYEHGVRAQLASWDRPNGGLADGQATTAMGGPYEPVDADSTGLAMNGDGDIDVANGETADLEVDTVAVPTDAAVASHTDHQGVGGPVEAQSGYPPCSPGPGDDRCIQLYERGVTGAGN